jgi:serine/threonine protein kinase
MTQERPPAQEADLTKLRVDVATPDGSSTLVKIVPLHEAHSAAETLHQAPQPDQGRTLISPERTADTGSTAKTKINPAAVAVPPLSVSEPINFEPGAVIKKRFLLEKQIGRGGMGIVFAAVDRRKTEALDPNPMVAMKILNADFARHPQALMALQREARKAQSLAHPNVATVFDFDRKGNTVF